MRIAAPSTTPTATAATMTTSRQAGRAAGTVRRPSPVGTPRPQPTVGLLGDPDRRHEDPSGEGRSAPCEQARLGSMEGHREVRSNDGRARVAGGHVDPGRGVDGDDRHLRLASGENELDRGSDRVAQLARDACPQQRIDDDRRPLDVLGQDLQLEPGRGDDPRQTRPRSRRLSGSRRVEGSLPSEEDAATSRPHAPGGSATTRRRSC